MAEENTIQMNIEGNDELQGFFSAKNAGDHVRFEDLYGTLLEKDGDNIKILIRDVVLPEQWATVTEESSPEMDGATAAALTGLDEVD